MIGLILAAWVSFVDYTGTYEYIPTVEEVAVEVMDGRWSNGDERRALLEAAGYSYEEVQAIVNEALYVPYEEVVANAAEEEPAGYSSIRQVAEWVPDPDGSVITKRGGINYYFDQYETYYNLPMGGVVKIARAHGIGGEYWVRSDGAKMLGDYIMLATNNDIYPIGTLVPTSLGMGISLDTGSFASVRPYQVDIAVDW